MPSGPDASEPPGWRPDLYVVARFLDQLWRPDKVFSKSQLQAAVRLNYDLFRKYLTYLQARGFVTVRPDERGTDLVRITPEGLAAYKRLTGVLHDLFGPP